EQMTASLTEESFEGSLHAAYAKEDVLRVLGSAVTSIGEARALCETADGPEVYLERLAEDERMLTGAYESAKNASFDGLRELLSKMSFGNLPPARGDGFSKETKDTVQEIRNAVKKLPGELLGRYFRRTVAEICERQRRVQPAVSALCETVLAYDRALSQAKREAGLIDFNDMEHFALQVLTERKEEADGSVSHPPSDAAKALRERFSHIMIDEYQDSSRLQEEILSKISGEEEGRFNRFMVGDVKQSIYRFRLAMPELFMEKLKVFAKDASSQCRRIDLHYNFRSGEEVLSSVNEVFVRLMGEDLGGVSYDEDARLRRGSETQEALPGAGLETELLLLETEAKKNGAVLLEAEMVAQRILRLKREGKVHDENGGTRPVRFSDIVILLRAPAGKDDLYRKVLEKHQIPVYVESRRGYYDAWEIREVLRLLSVINNPLDDIALVSVMRSPFGGFSDEALAAIRAEAEGDDYFYELVKRKAEAGEETELQRQCREFLAMLTSLRERAVVLPVHELLEQVLQESGFADYAAALPFGERRSANLNVLKARAADYAKTRYRGLSGFVGYVESLQKFDLDEGEANIIDENADVVRIMSIHKSKGLEFPVVFVADLAKKMNLRDTGKDLLADAELGIGVSFMEPEKRIKNNTFFKNVIAEKMTRDALGEELRVLYVAMTRAKSKLILTGTVKDAAKELKHADAFAQGEGLLPYTARASARTFLRWILASGVPAPTVLREEDLVLEETLDRAEEAERFLQAEEAAVPSETQALLAERFDWTYTHPEYQNLFVKTTVTELKQALLEEAEPDALHPYEIESQPPEYIPRFLREEEERAEVSPTVRGTVYHKAMELIAESWGGDAATQVRTGEASPQPAPDALKRFLEQEQSAGRLMPPGVSVLDIADLTRFLETALAARMQAAAKRGTLYAERQFMIGIPARELDAGLPEGEMLLVQGVIDCYFEEEGELVLLDYKTDHVHDAQILADRYHTQLEYYARALTQITGLPVKERLIWSFALGEEVSVGG
ncbi:MAG: UvrD-helicase domain-containing protein, partial [Lachnospiraceae bacterium]|nr:UvrD-helicase domain-containing protein [Lachnospiraceae bacterium]